MNSRQRNSLYGLGLFCLFASSQAANAVSPNEDFWLSRSVPQPQTRLFQGKLGNSTVLLRLAPVPGYKNRYTGEVSVASQGASVQDTSFLDGSLTSGTLELRDSSVDWEKGKVVSKPKFSLRGFTRSFPAQLTGTSRETKPQTIQLREVPFRFPAAAQIKVMKVDQNYPKQNYSMALYYPRLTRGSAALTPSAKSFNAVLTAMAQGALSDYKKQLKGFDAELPSSQRPPASLNAVIGFNLAANDLASGDLVEDVFYGGAHGVRLHTPLTYDFKRNRKLALSELFLPGTNYLQVLCDACRPALKARFVQGMQVGDVSQINEGTHPKVDNYRVWGLTPNGLTITFVDYQVGPYAQGEATVLIPYTTLKDKLKPEFVQRLKF